MPTKKNILYIYKDEENISKTLINTILPKLEEFNNSKISYTDFHSKFLDKKVPILKKFFLNKRTQNIDVSLLEQTALIITDEREDFVKTIEEFDNKIPILLYGTSLYAEDVRIKSKNPLSFYSRQENPIIQLLVKHIRDFIKDNTQITGENSSNHLTIKR